MALIITVSLLIPLVAVMATTPKQELNIEQTAQTMDSLDEIVIEPVKETVATTTKKKLVLDDKVLFAICTCESGMGTGKPQQFEKDGVTVLTGRVDSRDTGMCQINKGYHLESATKLGYNLDTEEGNWGYAKHLLLTQGTQPWQASASCWNKKL
jgi:hypothetical protein